MPPHATPRLALPFLFGGQGSKHITHNEALARLDRLAHLAVTSDSADMPETPEDGASWIVIVGWDGLDARPGDIATRSGDRWEVQRPHEGFLAWVSDRGALVAWDGAGWVEAGGGGLPDSVERLGIGTTADDINRLAVKSDAVLLAAPDDVDGGSGDIRLGLNRNADTNAASLLFSTNYAGEAEMGLVGDADFRIKTSADGAEFATALRVDSATAFVGIGPLNPAYPLHVNGEQDTGQIRAVVDNRSATTAAGSTLLLRTGAGPYLSFLQTGSGSAYMLSSGHTFQLRVAGAGGKYRFFCEAVESLQMTAARITANVPVRVADYAPDALPSPAVAGLGALVWVDGGTGGPGLAVSTGSAWRWIHDRSPVS